MITISFVLDDFCDKSAKSGVNYSLRAHLLAKSFVKVTRLFQSDCDLESFLVSRQIKAFLKQIWVICCNCCNRWLIERTVNFKPHVTEKKLFCRYKGECEQNNHDKEWHKSTTTCAILFSAFKIKFQIMTEEKVTFCETHSSLLVPFCRWISHFIYLIIFTWVLIMV